MLRCTNAQTVQRSGSQDRDPVRNWRGCKEHAALELAPASPGYPGRSEQERQAVQRIAAPADEVVLPSEDVCHQQERAADPGRTPEPAAAQGGAERREIQAQPGRGA